MSNNTVIVLPSWEAVIKLAITNGYKGPSDSSNNRAKAWSAAYLKEKGFDILIQRTDSN